MCKSQLSIISWNVEGLKSSLDDEDFLNLVHNFDLVFCSETWQRRGDNFELSGYECIEVPRVESLKGSRRGHGGVCLFIKNELVKGVQVLEKDRYGSIWVKLCKEFFGLDTDICVCFLYIPPQQSVYYRSHDIGFFEKVESDIRKYSTFGNILVSGDLNARCGQKTDFTEHSERYSNFVSTVDNMNEAEQGVYREQRVSMDNICNASGVKLIDLCQGSDLRIVNGRVGDDANVGSFTFESSRGSSLIDYVLASINLFPIFTNFIVHDMHTCTSHAPISFCLKAEFSCKAEQCNLKEVEHIQWDNEKNDIFKDILSNKMELLNSTVDNVFNQMGDLNSAVDTFADVLYSSAYTVYGKKKLLGRNQKKPVRKYRSPWFTHECELARQELRATSRAYRKYRTIELRTSEMEKRRQYRNMKRKAKRQFKKDQKQFFSDCAKNNPQKFWDELRKLKGRKGGQADISMEEFFDHFKNVYGMADVFSDDNVERILSDHEGLHIRVEELDMLITESEVKKAISSLKKRKSPGADLLPPEVFIEGCEILSPVLCRLFNYIFDHGIYPESWAKGILVPIPKKGDKKDVNNYRGITLTSLFSKISRIF